MTTRRRTKGEGSIIKTPNNKYRVRLDCGYIDGKRKQLSATCDTLIAARAKLREFEKLKEDTNVVAGITMSFKALIDDFLRYKAKRRDIKETTLINYTHIYNSLPEWLLNMKICSITMDELYRYLDETLKSGIKSSTAESRLLFIKIVFNYAVRTLNILPASPYKEAIKVPKDNNSAVKSLDILSEQEHSLVREALEKKYEEAIKKKTNNSHSFLYVAYMLAYELGMREGEIMGLRWSRINFEERLIIVDNQRVIVTGKGCVDSTPKTASSTRVLVASEGLIKILAKHKEMFDKGTDYVFSKNRNKIWHRNTLILGFHKVMKEVGINRKFTFHMLRHTNATRLIEKSGNNYKLVSERLGHASVSTTFDFYAHAIKRQHQLAADLMDCTK